MLKRLELVGFKSFAEKTRFEFAPGITAIVGPNGSGKSNVVDAVKWVLGEQSAKALRGGEMTDVIFNGSSTRRSIGMAEVSLTFDNTRQILASESTEVQITRRVYRDGEGEYLLNGQTVRLKDIKDLFLGSGAGQGAYSVIEQGRVDALLMASAKDRRAIFEEAAGISRFKAKKVETLRKLDRVDTDLIRVRDILQELEKQLGTLRLQASKAQKHREYSEELRRLRTSSARRDHLDLVETIRRESEVLQSLRVAANEADQQTTQGDSELERLELALANAEEQRRKHEGELAALRQSLTGLEAAIKYERIQSTGLETELYRLGKQRVELLECLQTGENERLEFRRELERGRGELAAGQARAASASEALAAETARIRELQSREQRERERQIELAGQVARLRADVQRLRADTETANAERISKEGEAERLGLELEDAEESHGRLVRSEARLTEQLKGAEQNREEYLHYREQLLAKVRGLRGELESLRERRSDCNGRAEVLESLERSYEGLGAGVREVLRRCGEGDRYLNAALGGLIGDLIRAPRDVAALVDLALGEAAQCFAVRETHRCEEIAEYLSEIPGRIGLIPVQRTHWKPIPFPRLSESVHIEDPELQPLAEQLLGNVAMIDSISEANIDDMRFITPQGELLEADGRLSFGPAHAETGIVSRKSELRELRGQIAEFDHRIGQLETSCTHAQSQIESLNDPLRTLGTEIDALETEAGALRDQARDQAQKCERLRHSLRQVEVARERLELLRIRGAEALVAITRQLGEFDAEAADLQRRLSESGEALRTAESVREAKQQEHLHAQVAWERVREHLDGVRTRLELAEAEHSRRTVELKRIEESAFGGRLRLRESQLAILRATATAAETIARIEAALRVSRSNASHSNQLRIERDRWLRVSQHSRSSTAERKDRAHAHEMLVRDLAHRRDAIAARMHEDYAMDLATTDVEVESGEILDPEAAEERIDELRKKLAKLGGVNQESLDELDRLEKRETDLRTQHDDLAESHKKLQEIIGQLNDDSRKMFVETLAGVKVHFQELFRKLFAGGQADIVLDENVDPLESGIEVVARPPGKELRSISLLSGGERTLTAIALLLAIFRSKPSPFCLLDEVDAALDEANTARLAGALGEFLDRSQFIIITHKKRTMAVADVLYGVTMQESGVSKQVSVRFEDWPEEEEIPLRAAA